MADWTSLLPKDPTPWLLQSDEPAARWVALALLSDRPAEDADVAAARAAVRPDRSLRSLKARLETVSSLAFHIVTVRSREQGQAFRIHA